MFGLPSVCFFMLLWYSTNADVKLVSNNSTNDVFVDLSTGRIKGRELITKNGNKAWLFLGIPYTEPPLGALRYRPPVPKKPWKGILNCLEYGPACLQNSTVTSTPQYVISEDCLQLNVFVNPKCSSANPCAILHFIHGGAWYFDSPRQFPLDDQVDNFVSKGVIMVSVSYREGTFAFWNTGSDEAIGNYGMYDMVESLQWVQREIRNFGGDPSRVTGLGYSSSSNAISQLTLSPMIQSIYHQGILMSGTSAGSSFADYMNVSREFAVRCGCATYEQWELKDYKTIAECMRMKDGHFLLGMQQTLDQDGLMYGGPRIDGKLFTAQVDKLTMARKPYPTLLGTTLYEMAMPALADMLPNLSEDYLKQVCVTKTQKFKNPEAIADLCIQFYTNGGAYTNYSQLVLKAFDDSSFVTTYDEAKTLTMAGAPVYLYSFDYVKKGMEGMAPFHAMDVFFIFGIHQNIFPTPIDDQDRAIVKVDTDLFTNFVQFGNPTPTKRGYPVWSPLRKQPKGYNYYVIDLPPKEMPFYHYDAVHFWTEVAPAADMALENKSKGTGKVYNLVKTAENTVALAEVNSDSVNWQLAFWITFGVSAALLMGMIITGVCFCSTCLKVIALKPDRHEEQKPLIVPGTRSKSYA